MTTYHVELYLSDREVEQLRQVADALPLNRYAPLVVKVLAALPFTESDAEPSSADSTPGASSHRNCGTDNRNCGAVGPSGGFQLHAVTDKGKERLPAMLRSLLRAELYTLPEPLDPRRGEEPICDNE